MTFETVDINDVQVPMRDRMVSFVRSLQMDIVAALEQLESKAFHSDTWTRQEGGGGISCVLQDGSVFDKAGVNVSVVHGTLSEAGAATMRSHHDIGGAGAKKFFATGISLVIHPHNPMAPTVHANYRYFEVQELDETPVCWWFGGGADLTPSSLVEEDAIHFHKTLQTACNKHDPTYYPRFKEWCDKYFYITHRQETRGIGGIFFDDLGVEHGTQESLFQFIQSCGRAFIPAYLPLVKLRKDLNFTPAQKEWQQIRRGRYVEFNLVYDRGTKFGLATPGSRIESILMSLPTTARWEYCYQDPAQDSPEGRLVEVIKTPKNWLNL